MNIVWVQVYSVRNRSEQGGYAADQSCLPYRPVQRSAGQGGSTGEQDLRVQASQVFCQAGELQGWIVDRERGCQGMFKFEGKLCGVKCAGAVSAVFRGESLLGELWGRQYSCWRGRLASPEK